MAIAVVAPYRHREDAERILLLWPPDAALVELWFGIKARTSGYQDT